LKYSSRYVIIRCIRQSVAQELNKIHVLYVRRFCRPTSGVGVLDNRAGVCNTFVGGPYNQLQTSRWATRNIHFFMYTLVVSCTLGFSCMIGKIRVLTRATLNGLGGRVVVRGPPVAHPCCRAKSRLGFYLTCVGAYQNRVNI